MNCCKKILLVLLSLPLFTNAQQHLPDSIIAALKAANSDSLRYYANHQAYLYFEEINKDSALYYSERCLSLAKKNNKKLVFARSLASKGYLLTSKGQYAEALKNLLQAFAITEDPKNASNSWVTPDGWFTGKKPSPEQTRIFVLALTHHMYAILMRATQNTQQQIIHFKEARKLAESINSKQRVMLADMNLGSAYLLINKVDSALIFLNEAKNMTVQFGPRKYFGFILMNLGDIARKQNDKTKTKQLYYEGISSALDQKNNTTLTWLYLRFTDVYLTEKQRDSSLYFAKKAFETFNRLGIYSGETINIGTVYQKLYDSYQLMGQSDSAYKYSGLALAANEKINAIQIKNLAQFQSISLKEQLRLQDLENEKALYQSKVRAYALVTGLGVLLIIGIILWRNNRRQKRNNQLLSEQKEEISAQRDHLEHQNHELEIEAALEQVRLRTMAMRQSNELVEVSIMVRTQVKGLGIPILGMGFIVWSDDSNFFTNYGADPSGGTIKPYTVDVSSAEMFKEIRDARTRGDDFFVLYGEGERLKEVYQALSKYSAAPEDIFKGQIDSTTGQLTHSVFVSNVSLLFITEEPVPEAHDIFKRFGKTFEQTYTRFLDLKQAEEQSREAQIQLALERVRARTMAMQRSEELAETAAVLFQQFKNLGEDPIQITIGIINEPEGNIEFWATDHAGNKIDRMAKMSIDEPNLLNKIYREWKEKKTSTTIELTGKELIGWVNYRSKLTGITDNYDYSKARRNLLAAFFSKGLISFSTPEQRPPEVITLLGRFAGVFDGTYTRFLDLQKAEAQAREAEIQLALERIRARTTAMQKSEELHEVIQLVFDQLRQLNFKIDNANFIINYRETNDLDLWLAVANAQYPTKIFIPYLEHPLFDRFNKAKEKGGLYTDILSMEEKNIFFEHFFKYVPNVADERKSSIFSQPGFARSVVFMKNTALAINNYQGVPYSEAENSTLLRFGQVFDETYTRFNDLKQAEAQTREAQIEAALERVRGKAMAMHNSTDLASAASLVFTELKKLGIKPIRCGVGMLSRESRLGQLYSATTSDDSDTLALIGWIELKGHPTFEEIYDNWLNQEDYFPVLNGKELKAYYKKLLPGLHLPPVSLGDGNEKQYGHFLQFAEGCLYAWAERPYSESELKILDRFKGIISLTFKRYLDLQKAEAATLEAIKQASVDRVRAEIASMRTTQDLERITPLIWNELTILNVPFIRCGIFIINEQAKLIHTYLSTPDGKALAAFDLQFEANNLAQQVLAAWHAKTIAKAHWSAEEFAAFTKTQVEQGIISSQERYVTEHPDVSLDLHFLPFLQGMLYVGNTAPLNEDEISLVQSLADAFSTAYARYDDFNKLELAKQQVENTLTQLKATQNKLIQSEKMASLGELTAGIAHEIQNPLNFVNNFSEVSAELIDEMAEELDKGDIKEVKVIAGDIKDNLEKIRHHGKRADSIVKGMLQHSRTNSGQKEPTDLNVLADEYLRLSYHGLRAKDKSFNAELITNFDKGLPKISVIPQEMGRVILNLINNAFYATQQKQKAAGPHYKPTVEVKTQLLDGQVLISVRDNGVGIPENIRDKIMQPFFTTKPTGEGTGLGLSLSYDIVVKGHGGKINIESKKGEGSEFIIDLPI